MLQNPCKTLGFKKNMVYKIPPGGGGKPYPASGLIGFHSSSSLNQFTSSNNRYVTLWRSHRVCAEAKTNRVSLVSSDLNPIEQLWYDFWRRILDRSLQPPNLRQLQVALH